ncbi:MFS transporter [Actinomadura viridis]|uniref:MFS transporter n=1 Tax=Actinomadura viridis TaxID=58110 RepID=UPI0036A419B8
MPARNAALPAHLTAATLLRVSAEGAATALVLTVQARTGRAADAGFLQTALTLPYVLSGPVIGHALDRAARPRGLAMALAAGYAAATAALLLMAGRSPLALALLVAVVVGCTEPIVVALSSLLPRFVPAERLPRAYALEASSYSVAAIAGPGLAAAIAAVATGSHSGLAIVAAAVVGAGALAFLPVARPAGKGVPGTNEPGPRPVTFPEPHEAPAPVPEPRPQAASPGPDTSATQTADPPATPPADPSTSPPADPPADPPATPTADLAVPPPATSSGAGAGTGAAAGTAGRGGFRHALMDVVVGGLSVLVSNTRLRALTVATSFAWLGFGGVAVTAVLFAEHIGAGPSAGGQFLVAFALGSLIGALGSSRWLKARHAEWVVMGGLAGFGCAIASVVLAPSLPWALLCFLVVGIVEGPVFTATLMLRQRESPPGRLGQVNTTGGSLKIGASAIGAALTGAFADTIGPVGLLLAIAACQLAGSVLGFLLLLRPGAAPATEASGNVRE